MKQSVVKLLKADFAFSSHFAVNTLAACDSVYSFNQAALKMFYRSVIS